MTFSEYLSSKVGSPQGTKLAPLIWLIYVYDLEVDIIYSVKQADDTTFYAVPIDHITHDIVSPAIIKTAAWSSQNYMILNTGKIVVLNTCLSYNLNFESDILLNDVTLSPSTGGSLCFRCHHW